MQTMNSYQASGFITGEPDLKATTSGTVILKFTLRVLEGVKNQSGEWEDYANFIECVMFGKRAESVSRFLAKGRYVAIEGKLHQNRWEQDGQKRSKIECKVNDIFLPPTGEKKEAPTQTTIPTDVPVYDDDIPF